MHLDLQGGSKQRNFRESIFVKKYWVVIGANQWPLIERTTYCPSLTSPYTLLSKLTKKKGHCLYSLLLYAWRPKDFIKYVLTQNLDCLWVFLHCIYGGLWLWVPHPTPLATFRRKCELDQHFRRKHELKPVVCETCGHKAKNPYELSNHTYRTHGDHDAYLAKRRQWKANGKLKRAALDGGEWRNLHHNYQTYNSRCQLVFKTGLASWQGRIAIPGIFCLEKKAFPLQRTTNHKN